MTADDRLIVALDVPNVLDGLALVEQLGSSVSFYKIGLGMLTGGGLALANELKQDHGKRIFLDMKFFDIGATVEVASGVLEDEFTPDTAAAVDGLGHVDPTGHPRLEVALLIKVR